MKSRASHRNLVLPQLLWHMIEAHEAAQLRQRELAGTEWHDEGWMFAQENGRPIDPRADRAKWKAILAEGWCA